MPRLSAVIEPLRQLTHREAELKWMHEHDAAFEKIKSMVTTTLVLKYYNPEEELTIQCDAVNWNDNLQSFNRGKNE